MFCVPKGQHTAIRLAWPLAKPIDSWQAEGAEDKGAEKDGSEQFCCWPTASASSRLSN